MTKTDFFCKNLLFVFVGFERRLRFRFRRRLRFGFGVLCGIHLEILLFPSFRSNFKFNEISFCQRTTDFNSKFRQGMFVGASMGHFLFNCGSQIVYL